MIITFLSFTFPSKASNRINIPLQVEELHFFEVKGHVTLDMMHRSDFILSIGKHATAAHSVTVDSCTAHLSYTEPFLHCWCLALPCEDINDAVSGGQLLSLSVLASRPLCAKCPQVQLSETLLALFALRQPVCVGLCLWTRISV